MPRKTGEEQLLHLAVQTLRQRKLRIQFRSSWVDRYGVLSYTRKGSSLENADQRAEVRRRTDVTSRRRWLSVSRGIFVLQCSDGGATPRCDATHSLQARRQITRRATANCDSPHQGSVDATWKRPHCKECGPSAANPSTREDESQRLSSPFVTWWSGSICHLSAAQKGWVEPTV